MAQIQTPDRPMRPRAFNPRGKAPQISAWGDTYNHAGQCAKCGRNVYSVTDGERQNEPDPRGFAGPRHSLTTFEEHPGVAFCWDCVNEHGAEGWKACEAMARDAHNVNACDHGHMLNGETRLLPTGGGGNVIVCIHHYHKEIAFRRERIAAGVPFDLPTWESLKVYGEVKS